MPKKDPFADFAEKVLSGTRVTESAVPVINDPESPVPTVEPAPSPAPGIEKKSVNAGYKAYTVNIRCDILQMIKKECFLSGLTAKVIINDALEKYFEKNS